jgi:hypothetical protein
MKENELGDHFDTGKAPLALLPRFSLEATADVVGFGAQKYAMHNWRKGISWTSIMSSALRHLLAFNDGEDLDKESGLSHLAHALCDIMFLLEYTDTKTELDDRYKEVSTNANLE